MWLQLRAEVSEVAEVVEYKASDLLTVLLYRSVLESLQQRREVREPLTVHWSSRNNIKCGTTGSDREVQ